MLVVSLGSAPDSAPPRRPGRPAIDPRSLDSHHAFFSQLQLDSLGSEYR